MKNLLRLDGWQNLITGLGKAGVDKSLNTQMASLTITDDVQLRNMYHNDHLAHKIIACMPQDALSKGYVITGLDDPEAVYDRITELKGITALLDSLQWERLFGGCALWFGVKDGITDADSQAQELGKLDKILWIKVLDRRYVAPRRTSVVDDANAENYGDAQIYDLRGREPQPNGTYRTTTRGIHRSRLVLFLGHATTDDVRESREGWGLSVLEKVIASIRRNADAWAASGYMMTEASYGELRINGLIDLIAAGQEDTVKDLVRLVNFGKSVAKTIVTDGEKQSYTVKERTFTGVPQMLNTFMLDVASAAWMPATKLFGMSAAGMNATGEGDADLWTGQVNGYRENVVSPALRQMIDMVLLEQGIEGAEYEITYPELEPMSDKETAELHDKYGSAAEKLSRSQVFDPDELAAAYSEPLGIELDENARSAPIDIPAED